MNQVKLKAIDQVDLMKLFDLDHAQAILDIKHPQKSWILADDNYEMVAGKITEKPTLKPELDTKKSK